MGGANPYNALAMMAVEVADCAGLDCDSIRQKCLAVVRVALERERRRAVRIGDEKRAASLAGEIVSAVSAEVGR